MKKFLLLLTLAALLPLASCGGGTQNENDGTYENGYAQEYEYEQENDEPAEVISLPPEPPTPTPAPPPQEIEPAIDLATAASFFALANEIWDADGGALWGTPLHARLVLFCADTRQAVANQPLGGRSTRQYVGDAAVYVGMLTPGAFDWTTTQDMHMQTWITVDVNDLDDVDRDMERTLIGLAFAAMQAQVFSFVEFSQSFPRVDTSEQAQIYCIMEIAALVAAWESDGEARVQAINDALYFRNARRQDFSDGAISEEHNAERQTGLIWYTLMSLLYSHEQKSESIATFVPDMLGEEFVSPYWIIHRRGPNAGVLYGLLLDEFSDDWHALATDRNADLGELLRNAVGIAEIARPTNRERYGYSDIVAAIGVFMAVFEEMLAEVEYAVAGRQIFLPTQYVNELEITASFQVPGDRVDILPDRGSVLWVSPTVITAGVLTSSWGRLDLESGFLLRVFSSMNWTNPFYQLSSTGFEVIENRIYGEGWVIELNDGWEINAYYGWYDVERVEDIAPPPPMMPPMPPPSGR